jgi:hypothetical protein
MIEQWRLEAPALAHFLDHPHAADVEATKLGMLRAQTKKQRRWHRFEREYRQALARRAGRLLGELVGETGPASPHHAETFLNIVAASGVTLPADPKIVDSVDLERFHDEGIPELDYDFIRDLTTHIETQLRLAVEDPPVLAAPEEPIGDGATDQSSRLEAIIDAKLRSDTSRAVRRWVRNAEPASEMLARAIEADERLENIGTGSVRGFSAVVAVTDRRVIVLTHGRGGVALDDAALDDIAGVADDAGSGMKRCPDCAEDVRAAARKCRFCGYRFNDA